MFKLFRRRRKLWAAIAAGLMAVPSLFTGVAAAPSDGGGSDLLPGPQLNPLEGPPADVNAAMAELVLRESQRIGDIAPPEFHTLVITVASRYRLDPRLIAAIITVETKWDPHAVGSYGELGLMQILPSTGQWLARLHHLSEYDLADPQTSVELGAFYISALTREHGSVMKAIAVYNGGPAAAPNWESNLYLQRVLKAYTQSPVPAPLAMRSAS